MYQMLRQGTWERSGSKNALKLLKRYNEEDTVNLEPIAEHVYRTLRDRIVSSSVERCGT